MINRKRLKLVIKLLMVILVFFLIFKLISFTYSRYQNLANSNANVDVALYVLESDLQTKNINLDNIYPSDIPYVYTFSIGNTDGNRKAEVDMEYGLSIRTTTNLPLTFDLFMNQSYTDSGATSIITSQNILADSDGTYFNNIATDKIIFRYTVTTTNVYQLVVRFPSIYNSTDYQDLIELIEITVNSNQIIE